MAVRLKFWGTRGSIACPSPNHVIYGGHTSCLEVEIDGKVIILDAGTGIRSLGHTLLSRGINKVVMLLTHTHWDHINGFPFFAPAFIKGWEIDIMAGHLHDKGGVEGVFESQMSNPMFPVPLEALQAKLNFIDFEVGKDLIVQDNIVVKTCPLVHPNGATGYRIEHEGVSICYITDTEHTPGQLDQTILEFVRDCDLMIYDSTYTDDEFPSKVGWGHSTWQEAIRLGKAANVKKLALFHHDPDHDDQTMAQIEHDAMQEWPNVFAARDNMEITFD